MRPHRLAPCLGIVLTVFLVLGSGCASLTHPAPFRVRNQHPIQLTAYQPLPRRARTAEPLHGQVNLGVDWANHWINATAPDDAVDFDFESVRTFFDLTLGLLPTLDLELEIPFIHASGGVLDGFIEGWHKAFGTDQNDREDNPRDEYTARVTQPGTGIVAYELEPHGFRLGDIPLTLNWVPLQNESFGAGVRAGVEFPTGDEDRGTGNGDVDWGLGAMADYHFDRVAVFGWASYSHWARTASARAAGLDNSSLTTVGGAIELGLWWNWSGLVQLTWEDSVLRDLDARRIEKDQVLLWTGFRRQLGEQWLLELAVGEDLVKRASPDVVFHFLLGYRW